MVFTKLSAQEKAAFFGLLDEYFRSRPELFEQNGNGHGESGLAGTGVSTAAAASALQRALATGSVSGGAGSSAPTKSNNPYAANMPDVAHAVTVGRVAAASLAFSGGSPFPSQSQPQSQKIQLAKPGGGDPPSLPRRTTTNTPAGGTSFERVVSPGSEVEKLMTKKGSVFSAFKKPELAAAGVTVPPAFAAPKNAFGPPPVRRVTSETSTDNGGSAGGTVRTYSQPDPEPEPERAGGEWAEVLYDYNDEDPSDLAIEAGTRVLVTDMSSDDWWTGQVEGRGKQGLFPASYVKLL